MLAIAYHFHVLPRHHEHFRHAYQAARETLQQTLGLVSHQFNEPHDRRDAYMLLLAWDSQASFEHFIRTWFCARMLNGTGLPRDAFAAPIETDLGEEKISPRVEGAQHIYPARLRHDCHV